MNVITQISQSHDRRYKSVSFGEELIKEMLFSSVFGVPLKANAALTAYRLMIQRVHRVATAFSPFSSLSLKSQSILLRHNADLVVSLRGAIFFEQNKQVRCLLFKMITPPQRLISTFGELLASTMRFWNLYEKKYSEVYFQHIDLHSKKHATGCPHKLGRAFWL